MKKMMAVTLTAVLIGGAFSYAAAGQGRGGMWGRGYGSGPCYQGEEFNAPCRDVKPEEGEGRWQGRGRGCGDCSEDRGFGRRGPERFRGLDLEGIDGEIDQQEEASLIVSTFLEKRGNPNLKVGKVSEAGRDFVVEIVTQDGSLANKVYVEKRTGRIIPAYR